MQITLMKELSKQYNPKESEAKINKLWEEQGLFNAEVCPDKKPYTIVIPPPNITGILHMGHALNNTIQDILIRYNKMKGYEALWMPGTDHAGIATQNVVERKLSKEGKKRHDMGREKFVDEVWKWQKEYGGTIIKQLRRLGSSCDWRRQRFTMDEGLSDAVFEVFIMLYKKGLIYRGNYIINWCPRCQTALSDEEAEHRELDGNLYYIRYPLKKVSQLASLPVSQLKPETGNRKPATGTPANYITVATTRPETMLGDTGLAINPNDERYKHLIGQTVILPIINREIIIIADDMVDPEFGTGVVKITPAHDPNDFQMGKKHGLLEINIMHPDGTLNEKCGEFENMDRFEAREALVELLQEKKLLEKIVPHKHAVGHCYRCHTIVEPYLSKQWFVKMKPLAKPAIEAVEKGQIKFYPDRWKKVYLDWMYNIRDWCISRQIWWGHRLPVYYCQACVSSSLRPLRVDLRSKSAGGSNHKPKLGASDCHVAGAPRNDKGIIVSKTKPEKCPDCGGTDIVQDPDVLDTWFSSWLWPFSTFGWPFIADSVERLADRKEPQTDNRKPKTEFEYFYPTSTLVTAQEIIFFWVARMIMAGLEFCKDIPFKDVYIHGTVRDDTGTKMSKSLGNTIDPIEIINQYGADALRFSIISITAVGQDVFLSKDRFESGRNFANKLWNVSRFLLMNIEEGLDTDIQALSKNKNLSLADKWILSSFFSSLNAVEKALADYKFNDAANIIYDFIWHKYCDWYVEIAKTNISHPATQAVLFNVLLNSLKMLHPVMPFVTELIWQEIGMKKSLMSSAWPCTDTFKTDNFAMRSMRKLTDIVTSVRNIRADMGIAHRQAVPIIISTADKDIIKIKEELCLYTGKLANVSTINIEKAAHRPKLSASGVLDFCVIFMPLEGIIDIEKEKKRLSKDLEETERFLGSIEKKLHNKAFIDRAPEDIVKSERQKAAVQKDKISRIRENMQNLA
jgi:valyl-tRNA synthetase